MKSEESISQINLPRLNNAEFEAFAQGTISNLLNVGYTKIGVTSELYTPFNQNYALLGDIISQSRISDETALIAEADARCDVAIRHFLDRLELGRTSPIAEDREAYISLYNLTKVYRGIERLSLRQQIVQAKGLVLDVSRTGGSEHIIKLGLTPLVQAIDNATAELIVLIEKRAAGQVKRELPRAIVVREEMIGQYNAIIRVVDANDVVSPSTESKAFRAAQNKLIADTKAAYNRRMGMLHARAGEEEGETEPDAAMEAAVEWLRE